MDKMRQKLYELKSRRAALVEEAETLLKGEKMEDWRAKLDAAKALNGQIDAMEEQLKASEAYGENGDSGQKKDGEPGLHQEGGQSAEAKALQAQRTAFFKAAHQGFPVVHKAAGDMMQEGVDADGGYTVPQDIVTKIQRYWESKQSLLSEVRVEKVTTKSGRRTFLARRQRQAFLTAAEAAKMTNKLKTPQFEALAYEIEKRNGYLPVTNEMMADSDAGLENLITEWLGDAGLKTINDEIIAEIKKNSATDLKDLDGIKKAWIGLGSEFRAASALYTNDNGLLYLDGLKDGNGRGLICPNPADPKKLQLVVGTNVLPIKVYDNDVLPNDVNKIPFVIGNLHEGITYWDRQSMSVVSSDVAVVGNLNAFEQDLVLWKGSIRDDCTQRDKAAYINGYIDPTAGGPGA